MKSISEQSFGKRLENAQALATLILGFENYVELNAELTTTALNNKIAEIKTDNAEIANKLQSYSISVDEKQKIFLKDANSINKIITPISANVRSIFGKNSQESQSVASLVTKIRGIKVAKNSLTANTEIVSQSERSYGTILQTFADLIVVLNSFENNYQPANQECSTSNLTIKKDLATQINTKSVQAFGKLKVVRETRNTKYEQLAELCQRLKETVKAQYGTSSAEYKLVKGLKI
jgi:hypothetical protein